MTTTAPPVRTGSTFLPGSGLDSAPPVPRTQLRAMPARDRFVIWGARFAGLGLAWIITQRLLPLSGPAWFIVMFAVCNLLMLAVGTAMTDSRTAVSDRVVHWLVSVGALIVISVVASVVIFVFKRGFEAFRHVSFWTSDMSGIGPNSPLNQGGILHAILGTLIELSIAIAITLPLGVGTAVFMNEVGGRFANIVRTVVEAMTALPSIVAGLFVYTIWIIALHQPRSGLAGALAISVMMLPIIARASDVVLRVVPGSLREASLGLGASRWKTIWYVVLPTARPGLATALILGVARGIGETSPVLITSGNAAFIHTDPTQGVMTSLPLFIFANVRSGVPLLVERAFGTAAVLLILVLILFIIARALARPATTKTSTFRLATRAALRPFSSISTQKSKETP